MLNCLHSLNQDLKARDSRLIIRFGDPHEALPKLIHKTEAEGIDAYIDYEQIYGRVRDLDHLDERQAKILHTWFIAQVDVNLNKGSKDKQRSPRRQRPNPPLRPGSLV